MSNQDEHAELEHIPPKPKKQKCDKNHAYRERQKKEIQNLKEKLSSYKSAFSAVLVSLLPPKQMLYPTPTLSCIQPILEPCIVSVNVGSHNVPFTNGKKTYHVPLTMDVTIRPSQCLLFLYSGTVHGGGPSMNKYATRYFTIYAPKDQTVLLSNKNHVKELKQCEDCSLCRTIQTCAKQNNGTIFSNLDYDIFTIEQHGFCVLNTNQNKIPQKKKIQIHNSIETLELGLLKNEKVNSFVLREEEDEKLNSLTNCEKEKNNPKKKMRGKSMKFKSIGQEETKKRVQGERQIMSIDGSGLRNVVSEDQVLKAYIKGPLKTYTNESDAFIVDYLTSLYKTQYEQKGKTILTNKGNLSYQKLHLDGLPL